MRGLKRISTQATRSKIKAEHIGFEIQKLDVVCSYKVLLHPHHDMMQHLYIYCWNMANVSYDNLECENAIFFTLFLGYLLFTNRALCFS